MNDNTIYKLLINSEILKTNTISYLLLFSFLSINFDYELPALVHYLSRVHCECPKVFTNFTAVQFAAAEVAL